MLKNRKSGFTLIELLVVIAIIGILSSVVLASLNTARSKGNDAAIKSDLSGIQTQAALYYDNNSNSYSASASSSPSAATCTAASTVFSDPVVTQAVNGIKSSGGATLLCEAGPSSFAISSNLKTSATSYWCVDSSGNATSTQVQTDGLCI